MVVRGSAWRAAIWTSRRLTPASSIVVTKVWLVPALAVCVGFVLLFRRGRGCEREPRVRLGLKSSNEEEAGWAVAAGMSARAWNRDTETKQRPRLSRSMRLRVPMLAGPDGFLRWWVGLGGSP